MSPPKRIAIIGAGASGLAAIKSCKEVGFLPVCYERNGDPGGLWKYHEDDTEGVASVMKTTVSNTSKEMSAYSDFPPPKEFPNYAHNSKMFEYFMMYAEHFDLLGHIRYNLEVIRVEPTNDFEETGRWTVTVRSSQTAAISKEDFDAVMVCMGHHVYPKIPTFPGQEKFKGTITHTHSIKSCARFEGRKVVVVGIGNSGVDAAVDLPVFASQVYLSTRRGSWIFARVGPNGVPSDINSARRINALKKKFKSYNSICDQTEKELNQKFDHAAYKLKPKHRVWSAQPTMNDALPNCILTGRVIVKGDIEHFEQDGIVFAGEKDLTEIDDVILATGYEIKFPFLGNEIISTEGNKAHIYKNILLPHLKHPTLGLIGVVQPLGAIFPVSEMQCRWYMQILSGKLKLPSKEAMEKEIACKNAASAKRYVESTRHTIQIEWIPYMDELSAAFGAKPNLLKMCVTDPKLFWACFNGPCLPYQYRLQGPHSWPGARAAILNCQERIYTPLNLEVLNSKSDSLLSWQSLLLILSMSAATVVCYRKWIDNITVPQFSILGINY